MFTLRLVHLKIFPLLASVLLLALIASGYTGDLEINRLSFERWGGIVIIIVIYVLTSFVVDSVYSLLNVRRFVDSETKNVDVSGLWRETYTNPLAGSVMLFIMLVGITNAQDLSELYRSTVTHWHDADLWALEAGLFSALKGGWLDHPSLWDTIYFSLWAYLMFIYSVIYRVKRYDLFGLLSISTVISFYMTRWSALQYEIAGPVFYQPVFFNVSETTSSKAQEIMHLYMNGYVTQNGFIPGTIGMPSLHVGLAAMATFLLACHSKRTLLFTAPCFCLIWLSTIMLGWHYILDGVGGIVVAAMSISFASGLLKIPSQTVSLRSWVWKQVARSYD